MLTDRRFSQNRFWQTLLRKNNNDYLKVNNITQMLTDRRFNQNQFWANLAL